jgi:hypothetical protein
MLDGDGWAMPRADRFTPGKEIRDPLYWRLGEPQNRSDFVRNISPSSGFDPRTVEPVASRYTDDTVWANIGYPMKQKNCRVFI